MAVKVKVNKEAGYEHTYPESRRIGPPLLNDHEIAQVEEQLSISMKHKLWDSMLYWGRKLDELMSA